MTKSLTLTTWVIVQQLSDGRTIAPPYNQETVAREVAATIAGHIAAGISRSVTGVQLEKVSSTYRVGDPVTVHAYAREREGIVTKLGRTRVTVRFTRNRQGDLDERAFTAAEVHPWDTALEVHEEVPWPWL